jgi:hypothetical protein
MILSKMHRCIFIKGVKVGGTSIEIALSSFCGPDDIITPITPIDELKRLAINGGARNYSENPEAEVAYLKNLQRAALPDLPRIAPPPGVYFNHIPLRDVLRLQTPAALDYRVVCVERNPYAKIFSWVNHKLRFGSYETGGEMRSSSQELKDYLDKAVDDRSIVAVKNIERYRGLNGRISAHVMRFEHLAADFRQFALDLGIDYRPPLPHAKKGILANAIDPRDLLDRQQITLINELFGEEFETYHYERV